MKKNTETGGYGSARVKYRDPLLPWFKVIVYRKGSHVVIDRYTGDQKFVGQSIYFKNKKPDFGLNYYGRVLDKRFLNKTDELFDFLKQALRAGSKEFFRGLDGFKNTNFRYKNKYRVGSGIVIGQETILFRTKVVYRLMYLAGDLEDRRSFKFWGKSLRSSYHLHQELIHLW